MLLVQKSGQALGFVFDDGDKRQDETAEGESLGSRIDGRELEVTPKPLRCAEAVGIASSQPRDGRGPSESEAL